MTTGFNLRAGLGRVNCANGVENVQNRVIRTRGEIHK
jgi:hypothetical protein